MLLTSRWLIWFLRGLALTAALSLLLLIVLSVWTIRRHDIGFLSVQSGSMEPAIKTGDAVMVRDVRTEELSVGDVISYRTAEGGAITTHRIHAMQPVTKQIVTKGDANVSPDGFLTNSILEGRAVAVAPYAGKIMSIVRTPIGLISFIYVPVTALVIYEALRLQQNLHKPYRLLK